MILQTITGKGSGESASTFVTGLSQTDSVSMVTPSGKTVQGVWGSKEVLEPYEIPTMTSDNTPSGTAYVSSTYAPETYTSWKAFDKNNSTRWVANRLSTNSYIGYIFPKPICVTHIDIYPNYEASHLDTKNFALLARNGDGEYRTLYEGTCSDVDAVQSFDIPNNDFYTDYQLYIKDVYGSAYISIRELQMSGFVYTPINGFSFPNLTEYGTYIITASNGTKTKTQHVLVDEATEFNIEMDFRLWLYRNGDEYEDVTGGWTSSGYSVLGKTVISGSITSDGLIYCTYNNTDKVAMLGTMNEVDLSTYSKLCVNVVTAGSTYGCLVNLPKSKTSYTDSVNQRITAVRTTVPKLIEIDISSLTKSVITLSAVYNANFTVDKVWLE